MAGADPRPNGSRRRVAALCGEFKYVLSMTQVDRFGAVIGDLRRLDIGNRAARGLLKYVDAGCLNVTA